MIAIYPTGASYKIGSDLPLISLPKFDSSDAEEMSFSDFQWWSYTEDFEKWLKANPREWQADSEDTSRFSGYFHVNEGVTYDGVYGYEKSDRKKVLGFKGFLNEEKNEIEGKAEGEDAATLTQDEASQSIKFGYAYNRLQKDKKIKDNFSFSNLKKGEEIALFVSLKNSENGENIKESMKALKVSLMETPSSGSKICVVDVTETLPGGKITEGTSSEDFYTWMVEGLKKNAGLAVFGVVGFAALKWGGLIGGVGGSFALLRRLKILKGFKTTTQATSTVAKTGSFLKNVKTFWGTYLSPLKAVAMISKGFRGARLAIRLAKGAGFIAKTTAAVKGFITGAKTAMTGTKAAAQAAEATNPIGWVLLAVDAIGSTWNWYSSNQAPRYGEVEDFAKGEFDPKSIPIGKSITVCWAHEASGVGGILLNLVANNDTRTTMELFKLKGTGNDKYSVFLLCQINSKEWQQQLSKSGAIFLAFDNSDVVERGYIDNEDLDFKMFMAGDISSTASAFVFNGYCTWDELKSEYDGASPYFLTSDPDAPETYSFNFEDAEENKINVTGKKVSDEDLKNYDQKKFDDLFSISEVESPFAVKKEEAAATSESFLYSAGKGILGFDAFGGFKKLWEEKGDDKAIGGGEGDAESLSIEDQCDPAKVAVYIVTDRSYANPDLESKFNSGKFTNFVVDSKEYSASPGDKIELEVNTNEVLENCKVGLFEYVEDPDVEEPEKDPEQKIEPDEDEEEGNEEEPLKPEDYVISDPEDIEIKNKRKRTLIYDDPGGENLLDKFLDDEEKSILGISNWDHVTVIKELKNRRGEVRKIKLINRDAEIGNRRIKIKASEGEKFKVAQRFVNDVKGIIKTEEEIERMETEDKEDN